MSDRYADVVRRVREAIPADREYDPAVLREIVVATIEAIGMSEDYEPDPDEYPPACTSGDGHDWVEQGTEDGERGTGRTVCSWCGADGDA